MLEGWEEKFSYLEEQRREVLRGQERPAEERLSEYGMTREMALPVH